MIHRILHGHWPRWYARGYDFIEVWWDCAICHAPHPDTKGTNDV